MKPQTVVIDSNVSAFVYLGDKRVGETPFAGKIPRSEISGLSLKRSGYQTVKLPVKKVYSRSSPSLTVLYTDMTSGNNSEKGNSAEAFTLLSSFPLFMLTDATVFLSGVWIEYMPNSFYVEMIPAGEKTVSADFPRRIQIKSFALKMYPDMAAGDRETVSAFSGLARRPEKAVAKLLSERNDPVSFAEAAANF